jgi:CDP-diglyceride synthetase
MYNKLDILNILKRPVVYVAILLIFIILLYLWNWISVLHKNNFLIFIIILNNIVLLLCGYGIWKNKSIAAKIVIVLLSLDYGLIGYYFNNQIISKLPPVSILFSVAIYFSFCSYVLEKIRKREKEAEGTLSAPG